MVRATPCAAIVIVTLWGGRLLPIAFAAAGRHVALIERDLLGGDRCQRGVYPYPNDGRLRTCSLSGPARCGLRRPHWPACGCYAGGTHVQTALIAYAQRQ